MLYVAVAFYILITAGLIICGVSLWRSRKLTGDFSRTILSVYSVVSAFFAIIFMVQLLIPDEGHHLLLFRPQYIYVQILLLLAFFLYPFEILPIKKDPTKVRLLMFVPLAVIVLFGISGLFKYTELTTYMDLWSYRGEFNVIYRVFAAVLTLLYTFGLLFVPFDYSGGRLSRNFIKVYTLGLFLIGLSHFTFYLMDSYCLHVVHHLIWCAFFYALTYYELGGAHLRKHEKTADSENLNVKSEGDSDPLWERILVVLDENDAWRNPDLTLPSLSSQVFSNRTYVAEAFKRNVKMNFTEYLSRRRVAYVISQLESNPDANISELFIFVGFRSRSTAWENFRKVAGCTPAIFVEKLKQNPH